MPTTMKGIIRGKSIELDQEPGLGDGQVVLVTFSPVSSSASGEGLRRCAGAWADEAEELEKFLKWNMRQST
jgi:hypothetical protein